MQRSGSRSLSETQLKPGDDAAAARPRAPFDHARSTSMQGLGAEDEQDGHTSAPDTDAPSGRKRAGRERGVSDVGQRLRRPLMKLLRRTPSQSKLDRLKQTEGSEDFAASTPPIDDAEPVRSASVVSQGSSASGLSVAPAGLARKYGLPADHDTARWLDVIRDVDEHNDYDSDGDADDRRGSMTGTEEPQAGPSDNTVPSVTAQRPSLAARIFGRNRSSGAKSQDSSVRASSGDVEAPSKSPGPQSNAAAKQGSASPGHRLKYLRKSKSGTTSAKAKQAVKEDAANKMSPQSGPAAFGRQHSADPKSSAKQTQPTSAERRTVSEMPQKRPIQAGAEPSTIPPRLASIQLQEQLQRVYRDISGPLRADSDTSSSSSSSSSTTSGSGDSASSGQFSDMEPGRDEAPAARISQSPTRDVEAASSQEQADPMLHMLRQGDADSVYSAGSERSTEHTAPASDADTVVVNSDDSDNDNVTSQDHGNSDRHSDRESADFPRRSASQPALGARHRSRSHSQSAGYSTYSSHRMSPVSDFKDNGGDDDDDNQRDLDHDQDHGASAVGTPPGGEPEAATPRLPQSFASLTGEYSGGPGAEPGQEPTNGLGLTLRPGSTRGGYNSGSSDISQLQMPGTPVATGSALTDDDQRSFESVNQAQRHDDSVIRRPISAHGIGGRVRRHVSGSVKGRGTRNTQGGGSKIGGSERARMINAASIKVLAAALRRIPARDWLVPLAREIGFTDQDTEVFRAQRNIFTVFTPTTAKPGKGRGGGADSDDDDDEAPDEEGDSAQDSALVPLIGATAGGAGSQGGRLSPVRGRSGVATSISTIHEEEVPGAAPQPMMGDEPQMTDEQRISLSTADAAAAVASTSDSVTAAKPAPTVATTAGTPVTTTESHPGLPSPELSSVMEAVVGAQDAPDGTATGAKDQMEITFELDGGATHSAGVRMTPWLRVDSISAVVEEQGNGRLQMLTQVRTAG